MRNYDNIHSCLKEGFLRTDLIRSLIGAVAAYPKDLVLDLTDGLYFGCLYQIHDLVYFLLTTYNDISPCKRFGETSSFYHSPIHLVVDWKNIQLFELMLNHPGTSQQLELGLFNHLIRKASNNVPNSANSTIIKTLLTHPRLGFDFDTNNEEFFIKMVIRKYDDVVDLFLQRDGMLVDIGLLMRVCRVSTNPEIIRKVLNHPRIHRDPRWHDHYATHNLFAEIHSSPEIVQVLLDDPRIDPTANEQGVFESLTRDRCNFTKTDIKAIRTLFADPRMDPIISFRKAVKVPKPSFYRQLYLLVVLYPHVIIPYIREHRITIGNLPQIEFMYYHYVYWLLLYFNKHLKIHYSLTSEKIIPYLDYPVAWLRDEELIMYVILIDI